MPPSLINTVRSSKHFYTRGLDYLTVSSLHSGHQISESRGEMENPSSGRTRAKVVGISAETV